MAVCLYLASSFWQIDSNSDGGGSLPVCWLALFHGTVLEFTFFISYERMLFLLFRFLIQWVVDLLEQSTEQH